MKSDQKREQPVKASSSSSPSSSSSTSLTNSNSSSSSLGQHFEGRQRLQRGAKDKVYATRLAADFQLHCDNANHVKSSADDVVIARTRTCATATGNLSITGNAKSAKQRMSDGIKPDESPKRECCEDSLKRKRKLPSNNDKSDIGNRPNSPDHLLVTRSKDYRGTWNNEQQFNPSSTINNGVSANPNNYEQQGKLLGKNQPSPTTSSRSAKQTKNYSQATNASTEPPPSNDWSCSQCTCFNSSRRRKCQACGIPRYLMVTSDGTFTMDDPCKANYDGGTNMNSSLILVKSTTIASKHPSFSQEGQSQQEQHSQLFAMMDAPLYTRSKRREQLSQTQSSTLTQPDEREKNDNGCPSQHYPLTLEQQQPQQDLLHEGRSEFQQWIRKRHTAKREKRQRVKRSRSDSNSNIPYDSASLGRMKNVSVRIRTFVGDGSPIFFHQQPRLIAFVPVAILATISLDPRGNSHVPFETDSSGEMNTVTVRITDSIEDEIDQLQACIPVAVLARISLGSTIQLNANDDRRDCKKRKLVKHRPIEEFQGSHSCDSLTDNDLLRSRRGSPDNRRLQLDQPSEIGLGVPLSSFGCEYQLEADTSHKALHVARPNGVNDISSTIKHLNPQERDKTLEGSDENPHLGHKSNDSSQIAKSWLPTSALSSGTHQPATEHDEKLDSNSSVPALLNVHQSSQGSISVGSPFVPMTQQLLDFDYLSQISEASVGNPQIALNCGLKEMHLTRDPKRRIPTNDHEPKEQSSPAYLQTVNGYNTMPESSFYGSFYGSPDVGSTSHIQTWQTNNVLDTNKVRLGFGTAESDALISVSEEATKLLADSPKCSVDKAMECGNAYSDSTSSTRNDVNPIRTDSKTKDSPSVDPFPSSLGFSSAGSGSLIKISDEGLVRATKLLAEYNDRLLDRATTCADVHGIDATSQRCCQTFKVHGGSKTKPLSTERTYGTPLGFSTAGSGALITVSEDCLSKASKLLEESRDFLGGRAILRSDDVTSETEYDGLPHGNPVSQRSSLGFVSAGSGNTIIISDESLSRASKVLAECNAGPEMTNSDGNYDQVTSPLKDVATKMRFSINSHAPHSSLVFRSAGSGALITVSDESLSRASDLLADSNECSVKRAKIWENEVEIATPLACDEKYPTNKVPKNNHLPFAESSGAFPGFACGSGSLTKISVESLYEASTLLETSNDCLEDRGPICTDKDDVVSNESFQTSVYSQTMFTAPSIAKRSSLGFATAGSGSSIRISDESLSRASKLLADSDAYLVDRDRATTCDERESDDTNPPTSNGKPTSILSLDVPSNSFGFACAGTGATIIVSDESLSRASKLLADKKYCLGDNTVLFDDEQDMFRACEDRKPSSTDASSYTSLFKRDESSISSDMKSVIVTSAPLGRKEDYRSRKGRRHGNQKVKFSLDSSQMTTNRQTSESPRHFQDELLLTTPLVTDSGHATKAKTHATCLTLLSGESLITPDNRQQIDEEREFESRSCNDVGQTLANVVTDRKDAQSDNRVPSSPLETIHHSPLDRSMRTPLQEMTNIVNDPLQSVMRSKRLFQTTAFGGDESQKTKVRITPFADRSILREVSSNDVSTLSQFASNHHASRASSWADCITYGVKDATMRVTSVNASKLRFRVDDELPLFFIGQRDPPKGNHMGKNSDIREWLCRQECDMSLITDKWIQNHVRWIVWKLAAMERRFPIQLGGQYLTFSHVLSQIKGRYEKELRGAKRPALRKILNRDVSACTPIILCVSQVLRFKTKRRVERGREINNTEEVRLELSDGWYAVSATLACVLTNLIDGGKICVGSKLVICNAQLEGSDEGVDPLDEDYFSDKQNCSIFLRITANNSRLARWDAKLGFVHPKNTAKQGGGILVKSLCDVYPNGGNIPVIDVVVCKRYPQMFLEQVKDAASQTVSKSHLTEAEEAARQNEYDMSYQRTSEYYAGNAWQECSEEIDEEAPLEWKEMVASTFPEDYYENLTAAEQNIVDDWTKKRQFLMQNKVAKSIEGSVNHSLSERTSVPYLRLLVKSFYRLKQESSRPKKRNMTAELTIWRVSEEQLHLMKEGIAVRIKNLSVRYDHDGILQLSAKGDTQMESLSSEPNQIQLIRSGFEERRPKSLIYINLMTKKCEPNRLAREVDVVACIVKIQRLDSTVSVAYLTDESGFIMKLKRTHSPQNNDPFQLGNIATSLPTVVELCNVQVESFDTIEQCATGSWGIFTCKAKHSSLLRHKDIQDWCSSEVGLEYCGYILDRLNAGLPPCATPLNRCIFCIGYILGFEIYDLTRAMNVIIDYGEECSLMARFPFRLLLHALRLTRINSSTSDGVDITSILAGNMFNRANILHTCYILGEYFRRNQVLFKFSLERSSCYGVDLQCHEVTDISLAATDSLCRLNAMHLVKRYSPDYQSM